MTHVSRPPFFQASFGTFFLLIEGVSSIFLVEWCSSTGWGDTCRGVEGGEQASSVAKKRHRKQTTNKNKQTNAVAKRRQTRQHTLTTTISIMEIAYRVKIS